MSDDGPKGGSYRRLLRNLRRAAEGDPVLRTDVSPLWAGIRAENERRRADRLAEGLLRGSEPTKGGE